MGFWHHPRGGQGGLSVGVSPIHPRFQLGLTGAWSAQHERFSLNNGIVNLARPVWDEQGEVETANVQRVIADIGGGTFRYVWDFDRTDETNDHIWVQDNQSNYVLDSATTPNRGVTMAVRCYVRTVHGNARSAIFCRSDYFNSAAGRWWMYKEGTSNTWRCALHNWSTPGQVTDGPGLNEWAVMICRFSDEDSTSEFRVSDSSIDTDTGVTDQGTNNDEPIVIGGAAHPAASPNDNRGLDGQVAWACFWNRRISDGEVAYLLKNPDGPFIWDQRLPTWINTAAAAPTTYTGHSIVGLPV
jgi:hypothetical protein